MRWLPFKAQEDFVTDEAGNFSIGAGSGYQHLLAIDVIENHPFYGNIPHPVKIINEDEYASRKASVLRRPSVSNPCGRVVGVGQFELCPTQVLAGTVRYLKAPPTPRIVVTQEGRTFSVDEDASQGLGWADVYQNKVVFKALEIMGINLDNDKLSSYGDALTKSNI
jgi:hypothetical protein